MSRITRLRRRFADLPRAKRIALFQAAILVVAARVSLKLLPFSVVRRCLAALAVPRRAARTPAQAGQRYRDVVWAVEAVGRHLPSFGTCLTQALTAHVLIGRAGGKSDLRIGVTRNGEGRFVAHAWLEADGVVVIGGGEHQQFTPMPVLNGLNPPVQRRH